jgi:NADPH-dependent glutamate synthase beta subunit-like oxidoreductase/NAD(P)H-flavin reductase
VSITPFDYAELHTHQGLLSLENQFNNFLDSRDKLLSSSFQSYVTTKREISKTDESKLLINVAHHFDQFVGNLFQVTDQLQSLSNEIQREQFIARFKKEFIQKKTRRYRKPISDQFEELNQRVMGKLTHGTESFDDIELAIARYSCRLLDKSESESDLEELLQWSVLALQEPHLFENWVSFQQAGSIDHAHLVSIESIKNGPTDVAQSVIDTFRQRADFSLTDHRMDQRQVQDEINYCVFCHDHEGDFCSKGFPEKKKQPELGLKKNPLGVTLTGCPLEEKISEMHVLKREGFSIGSLAVAMIDNPMIPATGHRICNDCMKACIYQKKDPVDIPQTETRILTDVLDLDWGVEIYDLLCRWNPLRRTQRIQQNYNGKNVLVAGLGPAGFTMVHHLTMEGCAVVGVDGLKIEPIDSDLLNKPVRRFEDIKENLDDRILTGFGGVAEYGITVRWDKNFLKLIYLTLCRRPLFQVHGGIRLGGTITIENAQELGFDHVCIATGAGLPRVIPMQNSLAKGMRQASDFLMALQLTGAAKNDSLANLQIRLPAVVIGGGLTAVDTATEVQVYYIKQIKKIAHRYQVLTEQYGVDHVVSQLDAENREILQEHLSHAQELHAEELSAVEQSRLVDYVNLLRKWGGVTIVYRRGINESPAYQRNHEELSKALEEGIFYAAGLSPSRLVLDKYEHVKSLVSNRMKLEDGRWLHTNESIETPARSVLVAAGTFPNTIYESEHPGTFQMEENHFLPHVEHQSRLQPVQVVEHIKASEFGPFTSYDEKIKVSFIGDTHPVFNGSVVNAIASAAKSYGDIIDSLLERSENVENLNPSKFLEHIQDQLSCTVVSVNNDNPVVLELWVRAPLAARNFDAGQFFRLQTYETLSKVVENTRLQIPLQTISGAGVAGDMVRLMLLRFGPNAKLASRLKEGDPIVLMGPTGQAMDVPTGKTFLIISGTWGAAVMLGLGPVLRAAGNRVVYIAAYGSESQVYAKQELEAATDCIIWAVANGKKIVPSRPQDCSIQTSDIISLIKDYGTDVIAPENHRLKIPLSEVGEVMVMGSTGLLKGMQTALKRDLLEYFSTDVEFTGTVGSPMQCMMKGVCGQCLQWQIDPQSGERTRAVFSCSMQDQPLMWIDLDNLAARQSQTRLQEHLTAKWVDYVLTKDT